MKFIFSTLLFALSMSAFTQEMTIIISAGSKTAKISLENDNKDEILLLSTADFTAKEGYLSAKVVNEEITADWKRSFVIYDAQDSEVNKLADVKKDTYCTSLKTLQTLLQPGTEYSIYTIALPKDPQKAMEVKIARQLVCKIKAGSD